jgi:general secretion pathway protein A
MYLDFYGLTERPFSTTPDPRFLYLTERHQEALARLTYAVQENKGFVVMTGEVGTGKTTLLRALLRDLEPTTAVAFVVNSTLPFEDLLEYVLADFGVTGAGTTLAQRLLALNRFLIEGQRAGRRTLLLVDEAQNLSDETLEQIRLLSNCETASDKLLQIVLVGQPELQGKLERPELRQLRQRIEFRIEITPLSPAETSAYVGARLQIAGGRDGSLFTGNALARIAAATDGFPRAINILCDHCLLVGYADQKPRIDHEVVEEAIDSLRMRPAGLRAPAPAAKRSAKPTRARSEVPSSVASVVTRRRVAVTLLAAISAGIAFIVQLPDSSTLSTLVRTLEGILTR